MFILFLTLPVISCLFCSSHFLLSHVYFVPHTSCYLVFILFLTLPVISRLFWSSYFLLSHVYFVPHTSCYLMFILFLTLPVISCLFWSSYFLLSHHTSSYLMFILFLILPVISSLFCSPLYQIVCHSSVDVSPSPVCCVCATHDEIPPVFRSSSIFLVIITAFSEVYLLLDDRLKLLAKLPHFQDTLFCRTLFSYFRQLSRGDRYTDQGAHLYIQSAVTTLN